MNITFESIEQAARSLTVPERAALAHSLLKGLDDSEVDEHKLEAIWESEAEHRVDAYLAGKLASSPVSEAVARVRARLRK